MARDYSLNTVVPSPGTPIGYANFGDKRVEILCSEEWRQQWFERVGTALFGPTGESDVTASIPAGSYVGSVAIVANRGLVLTGTPGPGYVATLDLSQALRASDSPSFVSLTLTNNLIVGGTVDTRDVSVDGAKLDTIATGATANSTDAALRARSSHTGTQLLATISDVTMSAANLNSLDDGVNSTLHFHNTDRDRANHTGTQAWSTLTGTPTTLAGYGITNAVTKTTGITDASTAHTVTDFATTNTALDALGAKINEIIDALNA